MIFKTIPTYIDAWHWTGTTSQEARRFVDMVNATNGNIAYLGIDMLNCILIQPKADKDGIVGEMKSMLVGDNHWLTKENGYYGSLNEDYFDELYEQDQEPLDCSLYYDRLYHYLDSPTLHKYCSNSTCAECIRDEEA